MRSPLRLSVFFTLLLPFIPSVDSGQGAEIIHHDIEAHIGPLQRSITVTDVLSVAPARSSTLEPFGFFLNRHLKLSKVSAIDGSGR